MVRVLDNGSIHKHIVLNHVQPDGSLRVPWPLHGVSPRPPQSHERPASARLPAPVKPSSPPTQGLRRALKLSTIDRRPVSAHHLSRHRPLSARAGDLRPESARLGGAGGVLGSSGTHAVDQVLLPWEGSPVPSPYGHGHRALATHIPPLSACDEARNSALVVGAVSTRQPMLDSWSLTGIVNPEPWAHSGIDPESSASELSPDATTVLGDTRASESALSGPTAEPIVAPSPPSRLPAKPTTPTSISRSSRSSLRASRLREKAGEAAAPQSPVPPPPSELPPMLSRSARLKAKEALASMLELSAEGYVELSFEAESGSVQVDDDQLKAAAVFDKRHLTLTGAVRRQLVALEYDPTAGRIDAGYREHMRCVRRNRYFVPESAGAMRVLQKRKRRKPRWRLETSCWAARLTSGNSKDFFETADAMRKLFLADWNVAQRAHQLAYHIVRCHKDPTTWRDIDKNGVHDEVDEVKDVLWQHHRLLYGAFDYLGALYSDNENSPGEPDVFNISFTAYMSMVERCGMISKHAPHGEYETIWAIVNAVDRETRHEDQFNKGRFLNRQEFMQCLVRCAIAVYVKRGTIGDVSDSLNQLMVQNLLKNMPPAATQNSNAFRKRFCYIEKTSLVLEANLSSIANLYNSYAALQSDRQDVLRNDEMMSIGEWMAFVTHMGLIESKQLSVAQAKNIFMWSRIRSAPDLGERSEMRLRHLFPVDFLEALVRMSITIALPTDYDIEAAGAADAGELLLAMRANSPKAYQSFLESHRPKHSDPDGSDYEDHCMQPVWRCVEHLIKLLVRTVEHNTSALRDAGAADGVVQAEEAAKFMRKRTSGVNLESVSGNLANTDFAAALDSASLKMLLTAAAIKIQMAARLRNAKKRVAERKAREAKIAAGLDPDATTADDNDDSTQNETR